MATKPFIYLSAGVGNAQFVESLRMAAEAGTDYSGVLCGRATWKDGMPIYATKGVKALEDWLSTEGVKNIKAVNAALKGATPWAKKLRPRHHDGVDVKSRTMLSILLLSLAAFQPAPAAQPQLPPGVVRVGNGVSAPVLLSQREPTYTTKRETRESRVRSACAASWTKKGSNHRKVAESFEASLDKSAVGAVSKWRFKPGMKDGKPVAVQVLIDVELFHPL